MNKKRKEQQYEAKPSEPRTTTLKVDSIKGDVIKITGKTKDEILEKIKTELNFDDSATSLAVVIFPISVIIEIVNRQYHPHQT